jgi:hypothetical protein
LKARDFCDIQDHILARIIESSILNFGKTSTLAFVQNGKARNDIIMKIFILFISLVFGIFAIAVYAYGLKHRTKELTDKSEKE